MLSSNLVSNARLAAGRRLDFAPKCRGACKEDRCGAGTATGGGAGRGRPGGGAGFLQGQLTHRGRIPAGRRLRPQGALARPPHRASPPWQSRRHRAEHAGRSEPQVRALFRCRGAARRHRHRDLQLRPDRRFRDDPGEDEGRVPQIQLDRQHQPGHHDLLCLGRARYQDLGRAATARYRAYEPHAAWLLERHQPESSRRFSR